MPLTMQDLTPMFSTDTPDNLRLRGGQGARGLAESEAAILGQVEATLDAAKRLAARGDGRAAGKALGKAKNGLRQHARKLSPEGAAQAAVSVKRTEAALSGLGNFIPDQRSKAAEWGLPGVPQEIAKGFRYAHPFQAQSAYVQGRYAAGLVPGHGGYYAGDPATAQHWAAANAALYPQLSYNFGTPWAQAWSYLQRWGGVPMSQVPGEPWQVSMWQPIRGGGDAQLPVAGPQGYPQAGQAIEKF